MEKPEITVTGVLALLGEGKSRKEIAEHYGISGVDCKVLFQHPDLKGRKTKKKRELGFILIDDLNSETEQEQDTPDLTLPEFPVGQEVEQDAVEEAPEVEIVVHDEAPQPEAPSSNWEN